MVIDGAAMLMMFLPVLFWHVVFPLCSAVLSAMISTVNGVMCIRTCFGRSLGSSPQVSFPPRQESSEVFACDSKVSAEGFSEELLLGFSMNGSMACEICQI